MRFSMILLVFRCSMQICLSRLTMRKIELSSLKVSEREHGILFFGLPILHTLYAFPFALEHF